MNELIKIEKVNGAETVNARDLHEFLEIKTRFNDWIINQINDFSFEGVKDYLTLTKNLVNGGKKTEYHITLDMAKELSMLSRTEKGKQARDYFIKCEKNLMKITNNPEYGLTEHKEKLLQMSHSIRRAESQTQKTLDFQQVILHKFQDLELSLKRRRKAKSNIEANDMAVVVADMVAEKLDSKVNNLMLEILDAIAEVKEKL